MEASEYRAAKEGILIEPGTHYFIDSDGTTTEIPPKGSPYDGSGDPREAAAKEMFQKKDEGKNRLELIEPAFIEGVGRILTFGAEKYEANNWKTMTLEDRGRVKGALLRHMMNYNKGEKIDPESGNSHLYHIACNLMFLDYFDRQYG